MPTMLPRLLVLGLLAAAALAAPPAASGARADAATASNATAAPSRLDAIIGKGVLRVGTTGDYKPFSYLNPETKTFEGVDIDMARSLAKAMGVQPEFVQTSWSAMMADFAADKFDVAVGGVSINMDRQKKALFSIPYMVDGKAPIARCADKAKYLTLADIDRPGVRVIVNPGGTNERFAKENLKQAAVTVYPDNVTIFDQIADHKADVMITDAIETVLQQKLHPSSLCAVRPEDPFNFVEKAYLLPRDFVLKAFVDQWLHLAIATKEFQATYDKWLK
jgi:cyclohexadienyl dehydratase